MLVKMVALLIGVVVEDQRVLVVKGILDVAVAVAQGMQIAA